MEHVMERFQRLPLGNICDANGKRGSMDPAIRPVDPSLHMVGRAYTVRCHPGDNLAIHKAITEAPDGSVLVIDAGGYTGGGHIGEIMCFACMQRGIRGLVIDGTCRDADDIQALGFPVFSRGFNPGGTVKETVGQTEIPIVCGGVPVRPGDLVVGNRDGVVVVAKENIEAVLEDIVKNVPPPKGDVNAPLQALIFDSQYDAYRGVIVYFRVMEGAIRTGMKVRMMASGATYEVLECGHLLPLGMERCDELIAGEVGYFTASIKNVKDTQVGDTVTGAERPAAGALPGYRPARAMVYCGIYTEDGSKYPDLRDALEKLQLNDASLSFEPESSAALGFGFRCGFLGMLHMEIIQERLEREFDLDLITTLPSVIYRITKTDGSVVMVDNPHNYPDPAVIELAEEPYAKVSIVTPPDYVGNIMPMCQERRAVSGHQPGGAALLQAPGRDHLRLLRHPQGPHQGLRLPGL